MAALPVLTRPRIVTFVIAAVGTAVFWALGLPLPFLFGPMAATLIAALAGVEMARMGRLPDAARAVVGVTVGCSVTPALLQALPQMAASIALIPLYVALIGLIGVPYFRRLHGLDPVTAFYAAMPGGLHDMVLFGQQSGGDVRALSLIQGTRVLILVVVAPLVMTLTYGVTFDTPIGASSREVPWDELGLMALAGLVGAVGGTRIGLFGATILGPLIVTAALTLTGLIETRPPRELILGSQFVLGMTLGVFYMGITWRELRGIVLTGVGFAVILGILTAVFSEIVAILGLGPPLEAFLAFAPGGQAELILMAIAVGADVAYILPHHLARVVLVLLGAPIIARIMRLR